MGKYNLKNYGLQNLNKCFLNSAMKIIFQAEYPVQRSSKLCTPTKTYCLEIWVTIQKFGCIWIILHEKWLIQNIQKIFCHFSQWILKCISPSSIIISIVGIFKEQKMITWKLPISTPISISYTSLYFLKQIFCSASTNELQTLLSIYS